MGKKIIFFLLVFCLASCETWEVNEPNIGRGFSYYEPPDCMHSSNVYLHTSDGVYISMPVTAYIRRDGGSQWQVRFSGAVKILCPDYLNYPNEIYVRRENEGYWVYCVRKNQNYKIEVPRVFWGRINH